MRILITLALSLILWTGSLSAEVTEPPAGATADAEATASTMTPALTPAAKPSCGEAVGIGSDLIDLSFQVRPEPFPNYCEDCKPCSLQGHCGIDSNGYYLGVCSPPGAPYCHYLSYSSCTCY